jgi:hypothetical protein
MLRQEKIKTMKKTSMIFCFGLTILIASCSTVSNTATSVDIENTVQQYPTVADLDVSPQRVETSTNWSWNPFSVTYPLEIREKNLIGQLLKEKGADVLVQPEYKYEKGGLFGKRVLTVTGYLAKLKHFRTATENDIQALAVARGVPIIRLVSHHNERQQMPKDSITKKTPDNFKTETQSEEQNVKPSPLTKKTKNIKNSKKHKTNTKAKKSRKH